MTPKQQAILDFIVRTVETKGYPPSLREIGRAFDNIKHSSVQSHLDALERHGYIRRGRTAREITIIGAKYIVERSL